MSHEPPDPFKDPKYDTMYPPPLDRTDLKVGEMVWWPDPPFDYLRHRIGTISQVNFRGVPGRVEIDYGKVPMKGPGFTYEEPHVKTETQQEHLQPVARLMDLRHSQQLPERGSHSHIPRYAPDPRPTKPSQAELEEGPEKMLATKLVDAFRKVMPWDDNSPITSKATLDYVFPRLAKAAAVEVMAEVTALPLIAAALAQTNKMGRDKVREDIEKLIVNYQTGTVANTKRPTEIREVNVIQQTLAALLADVRDMKNEMPTV